MFIVSIIVILALTGIDQLIKYFVVQNIAFGEIIKVIKFGSHDIFSLTHITNDGAAWSMMAGKTWFLIGLPFVVIAAVLVYMFFKRKDSKLQMLSLTLIVAGGLGNLIDRIRLKKVVDYILFEPIEFPIFNFADICVVIGAIIFCVYFLIIEEIQNKKKKQAVSEVETDGES